MDDVNAFFDEFKENHISSKKVKKTVKMDVYPPKSSFEGKYISSSSSNKLHTILDPLKNNEVEISIGSFGRNNVFDPSVTPREFTNLKNVLFKSSGVSVSEHHTLVYNKGEYRKHVNKENLDNTFEKKIKNDYLNEKEWGWRARGSLETPVSNLDIIKGVVKVDFSNSLLRDKKRTSFEFSKVGLQIDLTIVEQNGKTKYEIEMEIHNFDIDHSIIDSYLHLILSGMKDVLTINDRVLKSSEKREVIKKYNAFFGNKNIPYLKSPINKPLPLIPSNVLSGNTYSITPKFDGLRKILFFRFKWGILSRY